MRQPKSEYSREAKWQGEAPPGRAWLLVTTAERYSRYIPGFLVRGGVLTLCGSAAEVCILFLQKLLSLIRNFRVTGPVLRGVKI